MNSFGISVDVISISRVFHHLIEALSHIDLTKTKPTTLLWMKTWRNPILCCEQKWCHVCWCEIALECGKGVHEGGDERLTPPSLERAPHRVHARASGIVPQTGSPPTYKSKASVAVSLHLLALAQSVGQWWPTCLWG